MCVRRRVQIYSFAVIMWEALELRGPWDEPQYTKYSYRLMDAVERGERPPITSTGPAGYVELLRACWAQEPVARPPFSEVDERLKRMQQPPLEKESSCAQPCAAGDSSLIVPLLSEHAGQQ